MTGGLGVCEKESCKLSNVSIFIELKLSCTLMAYKYLNLYIYFTIYVLTSANKDASTYILLCFPQYEWI